MYKLWFCLQQERDSSFTLIIICNKKIMNPHKNGSYKKRFADVQIWLHVAVAVRCKCNAIYRLAFSRSFRITFCKPELLLCIFLISWLWKWKRWYLYLNRIKMVLESNTKERRCRLSCKEGKNGNDAWFVVMKRQCSLLLKDAVLKERR